ncbi:MAG: Holliday junction resolvase RuvX [Thermodesulfobacteriota bacterium]
MRILGLDLGKKTIGVAVSDEAGLTALPVRTIKRTNYRADIEEISRLVAEYEAGEIVVGLPVKMDGTFGDMAVMVLKFIEKLKEKTELSVRTWDERLSTVAVTRVLLEGDVSRARRKEVVDKLAAAYILQGYLDSRSRGG